VTRLTYLSFDSLVAGVGASQVRPYVERLAQRGVDVVVHSFEPDRPPTELVATLAAQGVRWRSHRFGRPGPVGGLERVARAAVHVRRAELLHARADPAAAAAALAAPRSWIWDMRSFWADERVVMGTLRRGSAEERVMRGVERRAAASSAAIIVLAATAIESLEQRHGPHVREKVRVIPTCVDLSRFPVTGMPTARPLRLLLSGSLNRFYDVRAMIRLVEAVRRRQPAELHVVRPEATRWDAMLRSAGAHLSSASYPEVAIEVAASHAGLAICRADAGRSLQARMPIKIAESLACGRPVVVNAGLGDMDRLLADYHCGVVVDDLSDVGLEAAAERLCQLLADPGLEDRCRALAEDHFDIERGVDRLVEIYRTMG
jgi:glycosyltransferase involved in cell wall biosynthesis